MTAVKLRIQDIVHGSFEDTYVHTVSGDVDEVRILGTVVDVFITDDESYISLTIDDGTETIRIKAWRQDVEELKQYATGDIIDVVGKIREYNEEVYVVPDVISTVSPNKWVLRELELMKQYIEGGYSEKEGVKKQKEMEEPGESVPEPTSEPELKPKSVPVPEPDLKSEPDLKPKSETETEKGEKSKEIQKKEESAGEITESEIAVEEFEILGEDDVVETVLDFLEKGLTKEDLIKQSGMDEIDVELALRELLDEGKITKEGTTYKRVS
ncbi:MAG: OB-fold nucleic acid binding domain-containing protein [Candidatus Methanofastidiosia archaeon]